MIRFGLLGKNIAYSFSKGYFTKKFKTEGYPFSYENFDLKDISDFPTLIQNNVNIGGFNVTIPYKEEILPYLNKIDKKAKKIGAVNTITVAYDGKLKGYNTDYYGFKKSIKPYLKSHHKSALILGTGGASKAIVYVLKKMKIDYDHVSRSKKPEAKFTYDSLTEDDIKHYKIIVNCTPVGTHPNVNICPDIPYDGVTKAHLLYDLIYNPEETKFMRLGRLQGAQTCNGLKMLEFQAEKAWSIWNSTL
ncbi:shikimate dehydrogenase [uncultured Psychroserpens sp.]|uniref:shikimate dehydrogenase family protein n=1 Tax=uncultured Psychroserpens sp. TaxID=255436 RepID=UPI00261B4047|nr:shikimate dehydrogenase [uncultured Psychroserpens sp.]